MFSLSLSVSLTEVQWDGWGEELTVVRVQGQLVTVTVSPSVAVYSTPLKLRVVAAGQKVTSSATTTVDVTVVLNHDQVTLPADDDDEGAARPASMRDPLTRAPMDAEGSAVTKGTSVSMVVDAGVASAAGIPLSMVCAEAAATKPKRRALDCILFSVAVDLVIGKSWGARC